MNFARGLRLLQNTHVFARSRLCWVLRSKLLRHGRRISVSALFAAPVVNSASPDDKEKLKGPDANKLTHSYLIRNACALSIDSASALFHQTLIALLDAEKDYAEAVYVLISLLDFHLSALNFDEKEQNKIWDLIVNQKQLVNEKKANKQELELLFLSVENVLNSLAQAAFLAGAEVSAIRTGEELFSCQSHLRQARELSSQAEQKLTEMDVKVIHVTSEHEEKKKKDQSETPATMREADIVLTNSDENQ
ncbi:uncharacterized protein LOC135467230 [Liolophura sinensis]|uniref:uncharacterized protein LOC135467230 n=1 Tax=Liolophura sinensis TaxID=3198878 RepID=UPI003158BA24